MLDRAAIASTIKEILIDVLAVEPDAVVGNARFFLDLGGESIDLLETQFQIDKKLKRAVKFQEILGGESLLTDAAGNLTADALAGVRASLPFLDFHRLPPQVTLDTLVREMLTVDAIVEITRQTALHQRVLPSPIAN